MEKTEVTIKGLTKVIKFSAFLTTYTDINPNGGINHRINGKGTGKNSKTKELTDEDKIAIRAGLQELSSDISTVIESLKIEQDDQVQS